MTRKKPNYTQFMKRPTPLELSPPSHNEDPPPRVSEPPKKETVSDEEIPWGEIIVEFGPDDSVPLILGTSPPGSPSRSVAAESRGPTADRPVPAPQAGNPPYPGLMPILKAQPCSTHLGLLRLLCVHQTWRNGLSLVLKPRRLCLWRSP